MAPGSTGASDKPSRHWFSLSPANARLNPRMRAKANEIESSPVSSLRLSSRAGSKAKLKRKTIKRPKRDIEASVSRLRHSTLMSLTNMAQMTFRVCIEYRSVGGQGPGGAAAQEEAKNGRRLTPGAARSTFRPAPLTSNPERFQSCQTQVPVVPHRAFLEDDEPPGDRGALLEVMGRKNERLALLGQLPQQARQVFRGLGVEARKRLIEQEEVRVVEKGASQRNALLEPPGKFPDRYFGPPAQAETVKNLAHLLFQVIEAEERADKFQVFESGELAVKESRVGNEADRRLGPGRVAVDVFATEKDLAFARPGRRGEDAQQSGLPCPVRPIQEEGITGLNPEP